MRTSTNEINNDSTCHYGFGWMLRSDPLLGKYSCILLTILVCQTIIKYIGAGKTIILLANNAHKNFDEIIRHVEKIVRTSAK